MTPRSGKPVEPQGSDGPGVSAADEAVELDAERVSVTPPAGSSGPGGSDAAPGAEAGVAVPAVGATGGSDPASELSTMRNQWLRAEAEIQNVRRRASREREELRRELEDQWLLEAAALLDDLDRGLSAARVSGAPEAWTRGFELAGQRVRELLQRYGVTAIEPAGEPFDPRHHEALLEVAAAPGTEPGTVVQVVTRGYARNGRALRAAQVAVARSAEEGGA